MKSYVMISLMCYLALVMAAAVDAHDRPVEKPAAPPPKAEAKAEAAYSPAKCKTILYNMFLSEKKPQLNNPVLNKFTLCGLKNQARLHKMILKATKSELKNNPLLYNMFLSQTKYVDIDLLYGMILAGMDKPRLVRRNTAVYNMFLSQFMSGGLTKSNSVLYYMFLGKLETKLKNNTELFNMFLSEAKAGKTTLLYHMFLANMILSDIKPALKSNTLLYNMILANAIVSEKQNGIKITGHLTAGVEAHTKEPVKVPTAEGAKPTNKPHFSMFSQNPEPTNKPLFSMFFSQNQH